MPIAFLRELFEVELIPDREVFTDSLNSSRPFSLKQPLCTKRLYLILGLTLTEKNWSTLLRKLREVSRELRK
jgi:hypothetical protein